MLLLPAVWQRGFEAFFQRRRDAWADPGVNTQYNVLSAIDERDQGKDRRRDVLRLGRATDCGRQICHGGCSELNREVRK